MLKSKSNISGNKLHLFTVSLFPKFLLRTEKEKSDRLKTRNLTDWEINGCFLSVDLTVTLRSKTPSVTVVVSGENTTYYLRNIIPLQLWYMILLIKYHIRNAALIIYRYIYSKSSF